MARAVANWASGVGTHVLPRRGDATTSCVRTRRFGVFVPRFGAIVVLAALATFSTKAAHAADAAATPATAATAGSPAPALASPDAFAAIPDLQARSVAIFTEAAKVMTHPRCANCHPVGDRPRQGEGATSRPHQPPVTRGPDGFGTVALRCDSCHAYGNFDAAKMPGHPHWHLAPASMAWEGKSAGAICLQVKDPERNGRRTIAEVVEHMSHDSLVGWAWSPGPGRTPAPGTQAQLAALLDAWVASGAACPAP